MSLIDLLQRMYNLLSSEVWEDELGYCRVNLELEEIHQLAEELDSAISQL